MGISIHCNERQGYRGKKRDTQCTYNVTLRRVHETIVAVEKE